LRYFGLSIFITFICVLNVAYMKSFSFPLHTIGITIPLPAHVAARTVLTRRNRYASLNFVRMQYS